MKRFAKVIKALSFIFLTLILTVVIAISIFIEPKIKINGFASLDKDKLSVFTRSINITDVNGNPIAGALYDKNKIYTPLTNLNRYTQNAFICVEDKRFYSHNGFDIIRIFSAMKNNLLNGKFVEGASTISQQLIKNTHLNNKKTIKRKLQEIRIARELERNYSKDEILEMYLNSLYFGNGLYGIGSASKAYFGVEAKDLTLSQSAVLASVINSPAKYDLYKNYENAIKRRNSVLRRMFEQKQITENEYKSALEEIIIPQRNALYSNQFINATINDASNKLYIDAEGLYWGDKLIKTYCNSDLQDKTQEIIVKYDNDDYEISALISNNIDNKYVAFVSTSQTDITNILRQPGSTIKPFVSFAPAIDNKNVYLCTPILDEKTSFNGYTPQNYNDIYYGWVDCKTALSKSLNVPAVKLMEMVGVENSINYARKFGLNFSRNDFGLATALGGLSNGLTLQSLVDAYQVFANNGKYSKGKFINEIVDKNGNIIFKDKNQSKIQIIDDDTAYLINHALHQCVVDGTAKKLGYKHKNLCAKTGTVGNKDGNTDAYCISYSPTYTVGVRISASKKNMDNSISGGGLCAEISSKIWDLLNDDSNFSPNNNIVNKEIDLREYVQNHKVLLAGDEIPQINRKNEIFSIKNMPKEYSNPSTYTENKSILDDFYNFKIIDSLFN